LGTLFVFSKAGIDFPSKIPTNNLIQKTNIVNIVCNLCLMKHNDQVMKLVNVIPLYLGGYIVKKKKEPVLLLIAIRV